MAEETQGLDVPDLSLTEAPEAAAEAPEADAKVHPAYEKLLNELPEAWHSKVTPFLQEQDKYFQQQIEKYTPFKQYAEQGIDPAIIDAGLNLAQALDNDPVQVFDALKNHLMAQGMLEAEAEQAAAEAVDEEYSDDEIPAALKKEIDSLRQQQEQLSEFANNQILERETDAALSQIQGEMDSLRGKYQISDAHETAIYDLMNAALDAGRDISVFDAAKQLAQMVGGFRPLEAPDLSQGAPTVVGSAGGAGVPAQNISVPKDDRGKREMLAQMFEEYRKANQ